MRCQGVETRLGVSSKVVFFAQGELYDPAAVREPSRSGLCWHCDQHPKVGGPFIFKCKRGRFLLRDGAHGNHTGTSHRAFGPPVLTIFFAACPSDHPLGHTNELRSVGMAERNIFRFIQKLQCLISQLDMKPGQCLQAMGLPGLQDVTNPIPMHGYQVANL